MDPYITVIVPVHNLARYLRRVLDSVVAASRVLHSESSDAALLGVECICIDDGSTDESFDELERYSCSENDIRMRVLRQSNQGVSAARNRGIDVASGKWICFIDGDDAISDQVFLHIYQADLTHGDLELFVMGTVVIGENGAIREIKGAELMPRVFESGIEFSQTGPYAVLQGRMSDKFVRKEVLSRHNIRFVVGLRNGEDTAFGLVYLSYCGRVFVDPQLKGYIYYLRQASASFFKLHHMPKDPFLLFRSLHDEWRKTGSPIVCNALVKMVRGVLSLCLEDYYDESARIEAIEFLENSRELRLSIIPFAIVHADCGTVLRLFLFCVLPHRMRIRFVHRICGGR